MKNTIIIKLVLLLLISAGAGTVFSQKPDTLIRKLDSLSNKTDKQDGQVNNTNPAAYNETTKINFPTYFVLLGSDLKQAYTKPFHLKGRDLHWIGTFALAGGSLALMDETIQRNALKIRNQNPGLQKISRHITRFGASYEVYTLLGFAATGFVLKNQKIKTTALLASQAYITGFFLENTLKFLTGRQRPYVTDSTRVEAEPTFHGPFYKTPRDANGNKTNSSFPSGHTTLAFAAATVYALEYKRLPIVPILSYSFATLVGLSRIAENKHWATDVLTGAAVGYLSGRLVVNNYHRYAKLKAPATKKNSVSFHLSYDGYRGAVGNLVYKFR